MKGIHCRRRDNSVLEDTQLAANSEGKSTLLGTGLIPEDYLNLESTHIQRGMVAALRGCQDA